MAGGLLCYGGERGTRIMDLASKAWWTEEESETPVVEVSVITPAARKKQTDLKMIMMNSSLHHAYAQMELDTTHCLMKREELSIKMEALRNAYFHARTKLLVADPVAVQGIEADITAQKKEFFQASYHA